MSTKKVKKQEFPQEMFVYNDGYEGDTFPISVSDINEAATEQGTRVGVYQLVKVVTVKLNTTVTVEE
jgi:hypothetical protein